MVVLTAVLGGLLFSLFIYLSLYITIVSNKGHFSMIHWFFISLATFNGIGFSFIIWATHEGMNTYFWTPWILEYNSMQVITYIASNIIFAAATLIGWNLAKTIYKLPTKHMRENTLSLDRKQFFLRKTRSVAWIMLVTGLISYLIYTLPYGGIKGLLDYSRSIRSGIFIIENPFSFLQRFGGFAFFSSYVFFGLLIDKENRNIKKKSNFFGFFTSFIFSNYVLYSWVGRIAFIVYFATFILGYALYNFKSIFGFVRKLFNLALAGLTAIIVFDKLLKRSDIGMSIIEIFVNELSFPVASFIANLNLHQYRWFKDIVIAPLYILPNRIWSGMLNIDTASIFNTLVFFGARKGESGITGSVPVDMLTFSYIQGSLIGTILVGFIWGGLLVFLERIVNRIQVKGVRTVINSNIILNIVMLSVLYADPLHIITRNFDLIIGLFALAFLSKIKFRLVLKKQYNRLY